MYYRLDVDQIHHERVVFTIMDLLDALGGVPGIMLQIAGWVIGGYAAFHSSIITLGQMFIIKNAPPNTFEVCKKCGEGE